MDTASHRHVVEEDALFAQYVTCLEEAIAKHTQLESDCDVEIESLFRQMAAWGSKDRELEFGKVICDLCDKRPEAARQRKDVEAELDHVMPSHQERAETIEEDEEQDCTTEDEEFVEERRVR